MNLAATDARQYRRALASDVRLGSEAEVSAGPAPRRFSSEGGHLGHEPVKAVTARLGWLNLICHALFQEYVNLYFNPAHLRREKMTALKKVTSPELSNAPFICCHIRCCRARNSGSNHSFRSGLSVVPARKRLGYPGICHFASYAQCLATASGTFSYCGINPHVTSAPQLRGYWRGAYEPNERWAARRIR